jgi:hypothetical protein
MLIKSALTKIEKQLADSKGKNADLDKPKELTLEEKNEKIVFFFVASEEEKPPSEQTINDDYMLKVILYGYMIVIITEIIKKN